MTVVKLFEIVKEKNWVYYSYAGHRAQLRDVMRSVNLSGKFLFVINAFSFNIKEIGRAHV